MYVDTFYLFVYFIHLLICLSIILISSFKLKCLIFENDVRMLKKKKDHSLCNLFMGKIIYLINIP